MDGWGCRNSREFAIYLRPFSCLYWNQDGQLPVDVDLGQPAGRSVADFQLSLRLSAIQSRFVTDLSPLAHAEALRKATWRATSSLSASSAFIHDT